MTDIEQRAAIDPIIQGLSGRLRTITATNEELVYAITEVLKGVLKPSVNWTVGNATRYLSVLRHADRVAQDEIVTYERDRKPLSGPATVDVVVKPGGEVFNFYPSDLAVVPGCQDVKFEIKDAERSELFDEMVEKYLPRCGCCTSGCSKKEKP